MGRPMSLNGYSWVEGNVVNLIDPSVLQGDVLPTEIDTGVGGGSRGPISPDIISGATGRSWRSGERTTLVWQNSPTAPITRLESNYYAPHPKSLSHKGRGTFYCVSPPQPCNGEGALTEGQTGWG